MTISKKCAIYVRVSKADGSQTVANQEPEVRAAALARGFEIVETFEDRESAMRHRPAFDRMMAAARRGSYSAIVVWSLDRLGRGFACFDTYRALSNYGVTVVSVREPWSEVEGPQRDLLAAIMAWVGGFERQRLVERTRAGLDRARRQGKRLGRPKARVDIQKALQLRQQGLGLRAVAREVGCGASTLSRLLGASKALAGRDGQALSTPTIPVGVCSQDGVGNPASPSPEIRAEIRRVA